MIKKQTAVTWALAAIMTLAFAPAGYAQNQPATAAKSAPATAAASGEKAVPVNNALCPVSGEPKEGKGVNVTYKGHVVMLCCKGCVKKFNANPDAYLKKAMEGKKTTSKKQDKESSAKKSSKESAAAQDVKNAHCPISGKAIGSMGEGVAVVHNGEKVTLCCAGCKKKFEADPDKYTQAAMADTKRP